MIDGRHLAEREDTPMDKTERMKDGTEVEIRRLAAGDIDRLMDFYGSLPEEDRKYLKFDVMDKKVVAKRLRRIDSGDDIRIVARMMRPQAGAQKIFRQLGFHVESMLPDFVMDRLGKSQDLIVMSCEVKDLWKELDRLFSESDWQRCR
jgi:hypothetical protein